MSAFLLTVILTFISTEIDDFILFMFLYNQYSDRRRFSVFFGQLCSLLLTVLLCSFVALLLMKVPEKILKLAGIVPLLLAVKSIFAIFSDKTDNASDSQKPGFSSAFLTAFFLALSSSSDNIGIYIPVFTKFSFMQKFSALGIFVLLQAVWSFFQFKFCTIEIIDRAIKRTAKFLVPAIYILLGLSILL